MVETNSKEVKAEEVKEPEPESKEEEAKVEEPVSEDKKEEAKPEEAEKPAEDAATKPDESKDFVATTDAADVVKPEEPKTGEVPTTDPAAPPPPAKKPKSESKEGPMGDLRPSDVLAGNYRKRAGNFLFKKMLRDVAPDVGKIEMRLLVAKIFDGIASQEPGGRFIREGGDALLSRAQTNQKIARALREVKERSEKDPNDKSAEKPKKPKAVAAEKEEPVGEIRPTDVLTGNYRKRPGNYLYKKLLRDNAPSVATEEMRAVVTRVIEGIYGQEPSGRFIREGGGGLLTRGQVHQKVARALREVVERTKEGAKTDGEAKVVVKKKTTSSEKQEPMGEVRPTDVLTGNYRKRAGNALYKKLLRDNAPAVGKEEMGLVVSRVIEGINGQEPPGRFIREGGGALLTRGQVRQKVARALREVVERTKNPNKDKEEREARKLAAAQKATLEAEAKGETVVKPDEKKDDPMVVDEPVVANTDEVKEETKEEAKVEEEPITKKDEAKEEPAAAVEEEEPEKEEEKKEPAAKKGAKKAAAVVEKKDDKKSKKEEKKEEPKTRKTRRQEAPKEDVVEAKPAKRTRKK